MIKCVELEVYGLKAPYQCLVYCGGIYVSNGDRILTRATFGEQLVKLHSNFLKVRRTLMSQRLSGVYYQHTRASDLFLKTERGLEEPEIEVQPIVVDKSMATKSKRTKRRVSKK